MAIIVVVIALALQRFLHLNSFGYCYDWATPYAAWMRTRFPVVQSGNGFMGIAMLVVPVLLVVAVVMTLFYHLLGVLGYYLASLALFWYFADGRDLVKHPYEGASPKQLFEKTYHGLFANIFWYVVFGPVGLSLYVSSLAIRKWAEADGTNEALTKTAENLQGALDWIPMRLVGLSFALVGSFSGVFKTWLPHLIGGISQVNKYVTQWGLAAIHGAPIEATEGAGAKAGAKLTVNDVSSLVDRALLVWVVVIALFTIGYWIGLI